MTDVGTQRTNAVAYASDIRGMCWRCQLMPTKDPLALCDDCRGELIEGDQ